jgi:hypothetical protein
VIYGYPIDFLIILFDFIRVFPACSAVRKAAMRGSRGLVVVPSCNA